MIPRSAAENDEAQSGPREEVKEDKQSPHHHRGTAAESRMLISTVYNPYFTGQPRHLLHTTSREVVDRREIIRRIKDRESLGHDVSEGARTSTDTPVWPAFATDTLRDTAG